MTLSITLSPEAESKLRQRAGADGESVDAYAARLLERAVAGASVEELLAPFRQQVADSGMDDRELDDFFDDVRSKVHEERQARRPA